MLDDISRLQRTWRVVATLHILLLLHLGYYVIFQENKGNSTAFLVLAAVVAGIALGMIALALWLAPARIPLLRARAAWVRWPLVAVGNLFLLGFGLNIRPEWIYPHSALMIAVSLALIFWTLDGVGTPLHCTPSVVVGIFVVVLVVIGVRVYGLSVYPSIQYADEGIHLSWLVSYNEIGELTDWLYLGGEGFEGKSYTWIPRYYVPFAYWSKLVGIGMWQARLYTFTLTLITAGITGWAARNLYNSPTTGLFTAGVLFASATLMVGARIRHDIGLALAVALSLLLYSEALKRNRGVLHLLGGMVIGLGMVAHMHASGIGVVLLISLYLPRYIARARRGQFMPERGMWLYGIGGLIGMVLGMTIQAGPEFWTFFDVRRPRNPHSVLDFLNAVHDHIANIARFSQLELALIALGVGAALWRRRDFDASLVLLAILGPVALGLMARVAWDQLVVHIIPIGGIAIGALFGEGLRRHHHRPRPLMTPVAAAFMLFLVPQLGVTLSAPLAHVIHREPVQPPPPPGVQWVLDNVEPGATVSGEVYHFFWLHEYRFVAPRTPSHMRPSERVKYGDGSLEAIWDAIGAEAFIFDPSVGTCCVLTPLQRDGYFDARGYVLVGKFPYNGFNMRVYARDE